MSTKHIRGHGSLGGCHGWLIWYLIFSSPIKRDGYALCMNGAVQIQLSGLHVCSASLERSVLCSKWASQAGSVGGEREGRIGRPLGSAAACAALSQPQRVRDKHLPLFQRPQSTRLWFGVIRHVSRRKSATDRQMLLSRTGRHRRDYRVHFSGWCC